MTLSSALFPVHASNSRRNIASRLTHARTLTLLLVFLPCFSLLPLLAEEAPLAGTAGQPPAAAPSAVSGPRRRFMDVDQVHDPSTIIEQDGVYRFFSTGSGITLL